MSKIVRPFAALLLVLSSLGGLGCEGRIELQGTEQIPGFSPGIDPANPIQTEPPPGTIMRPPDEMIEDESCQFIDPGTTPLRRLTAQEFHNSVRDVFPFAAIPTQSFTPDERPQGFEANTVLAVGDLQAEEYQRAAENIAEIVAANLDGVLAMDADAAAVREFIEVYGKRAFRRPLADEEVDALYALFESGSTQFDAPTGAQMLVEAILQSPSFLYRVEVGEASTDEVVPLSDYEVASRLSYFLWGSTPDDALLTAADAGALSTRDEIETHARRMIADDRARVRINDVFAQWLRVDEIDRVDNPDPAFTDEMRESMIAETRTFIDDVLWEGEGTVSALLTADYTFVDANTAPLYGMDVDEADGMVRMQMPAGRKGILGQTSLLTTQGHGQMPVYRGKFIRDAFLCLSDSPPPPPDTIEPLETFEGESMRSKAEKRLNARTEGCAGCHGMMDRIGLAFDNYDSLGRYQTEDQFGNALTGQTEIMFTRTTDGPVDGIASLADKLAGSEEVQDCASVQFFRYAAARASNANDACSLHVVGEALANSGNDVREMLIALTTTDAFMYRRNLSAGL